tara:strand:- start:31537 stop:33159 length:1623 start_codon:yes stop_codon:yes gene_type:complete
VFLDFHLSEFLEPLEFFFIGDSHSIAYNNLLYDSNNYTKRHIITKSAYLGGVQAANILSKNGKIRPDIISSLRLFGLISKYGEVLHISGSKASADINIASQSKRKVPVITFCVGEIDVRTRVLQQLGDSFDFALPSVSSSSWLSTTDSGPVISVQIIKKLIRDTYTPLLQALSQLVRSGFTRTYLHCLPPPTLNNEAFEAINGYSFSRRFHYKVVYLINEFLKSECTSHNIRFIDIWDEVTIDDRLSDNYTLDDTHLNKQACSLAIKAILSDIANNPDPKALGLQYHKLLLSCVQDYKSNTNAIHSNNDYYESFKAKSLYVSNTLLDKNLVSSIHQSLDFDLCIENYVPLYDWIGGRGKSVDIHNKCCSFSTETLSLIYQLFYADKTRTTIESIMSSKFVTLVRGRMSSPHKDDAVGSQAFHRDGNPPGILRGIVYLSDVDKSSGPFEIVLEAKTKRSTIVCGPSSTFILFDAQRYYHRGSPPLNNTRYALDLVFIPCRSDNTSFVMHQSQNSWPVDPYSFDISSFTSWPVLHEQTISLG